MLYPLLKALHVIGVVTWFAGLLYITRLYIYHVEANKKPEVERKVIQDQLEIMMRRLWYGITSPAMMITAILGIWVMVKFGIYKQGWLHLKLTFVLALIMYHVWIGRIRKNIVAGKNKLSSFKLRLINEIGTAFLIVIVLIAYLKDFFNGVWALVVFLVGMLILVAGVMFYKKSRDAKTDQNS